MAVVKVLPAVLVMGLGKHFVLAMVKVLPAVRVLGKLPVLEKLRVLEKVELELVELVKVEVALE